MFFNAYKNPQLTLAFPEPLIADYVAEYPQVKLELILSNMAAPQKLQLRDQKGLVYNPLTQNFKLSQFMGVAYLLAMQKADT